MPEPRATGVDIAVLLGGQAEGKLTTAQTFLGQWHEQTCMEGQLVQRHNLHRFVPRSHIWDAWTSLPFFMVSLHGVRAPHAYLPCQVEVRVVCQVDGCRLAALSSIVDGQLAAIERVGDPDLQLPGVAFLAVGAEPKEANTVWDDLGAPENLQGPCVSGAAIGDAVPFSPCPALGRTWG